MGEHRPTSRQSHGSLRDDVHFTPQVYASQVEEVLSVLPFITTTSEKKLIENNIKKARDEKVLQEARSTRW
jgi:hypothetical protein